MAAKTLSLDPALYSYMVAHGTPPDPVLDRLAKDTEAMGLIGRMQIAPEQGALLTILARLVTARLIVEVGTFTGYSSVCLARGLAPGGFLICCDVSADFTARARQAWQEDGIEDRIELRLGPALDTLRAMPHDPVIDFAFIDADKSGYAAYYEELVERLRPGGLIAVDNVLWSGQVLDPDDTSKDTEALRRFNDMVAADERVDRVMLSIADGLTLCRKR
jgi:predicted O-methyltransferase YrrM